MGEWPIICFPSGSDGKESACNEGDPGSIPGSGRSPGEGNSYPLQYSCLWNPQGQRGLASYSLWSCKELDTNEPLSTHISIIFTVFVKYLQCGRPRFHPWVRKIPWRREWQPTSEILSGESHGQQTRQATVHRVAKSQT